MTDDPRPLLEEDEEDTFIGVTVANRFQVVERIGAGGMGRVYAAKQIGMNRVVALKVLQPEHATDPEVVARFELEMKATTRVDHPNTVHVYDFGQTDRGDFYLAMELLDGRDLEELLVDLAPLTAAHASHLGRQIALALEAAHAQGVIHRDLKTENVMIIDRYDARGHVKVLDFGLARFAEASESAPLTAYGSRVGTPQFMAPEYISGEPVDHRVDLYALGVILFYMVTGHPPFKGKNPYAILEKHVNKPPPRPSALSPIGCPEWLEVVILQLMEKDPDLRPQSAREVAKTLERGLIYEEATSNVNIFEELSGTHPLPMALRDLGKTPDPAGERFEDDPTDVKAAAVAGLVGAAAVLGAFALIGLGVLLAIALFG